MFLAQSIVMTIVLLFLPFSAERGKSKKPPPEVPPVEISFQRQVKSIFKQYGCLHCHGGSAGLIVETVDDLLEGGDRGPAIVPGNADESLIIKKISANPPFRARMPRGGPIVPDSTIQILRSWINKGARNN